VVVNQNASGDPRLAGFVTLHDNQAPPDLRGYLTGRLPHFMVPAVILPVAAFPLTGNGKIDRAALAGYQVSAASGRRYSPPRTPSETVIAGAWAQALGVPRVGRNDGFFELGGDSLTAGRLVGRLGRLLGVDLPLRVFFDVGMTVASLAAAVDSGEFPPTSTPATRIPRRARLRTGPRTEERF
jgi:hypothetical protein